MDKQRKVIIISLICGLVFGLGIYVLREYLSIRSLRQQIKLADAEFKAMEAQKDEVTYMSEGDIPYIIRGLIASLPKKTGVDVEKIVPQKIKLAGELKNFPVEIEMFASQAKLENYLAQLRAFKTPVYVERLTLKTIDAKTMAAKANISFLLVGGKATIIVSQESTAQKNSAASSKKTKSKRRWFKPAEKVTVPSLQGVIQGDEQKAIINDKIIGVGEQVNGFTVKKINDGQVILEKSGKSYKLNIK